MLRWIGGCAVVAVVLIALGMWTGYRRISDLAEDGPAETTVVHAPAERVFAMVANADSLPLWRMEGTAIRASRAGQLQVGDSIVARSAAGGATMVSIWHVSALVPSSLIAFEMRSDSGSMIAARRDSLIALGDSTRIISTTVATLVDPIPSAQRDSGAGTAIPRMASKVFLAAARMQTRAELLRLKTRVEGDSVAPPRQ